MRYVENYRISQQSIWSILFQILFLQISGLAKAFISAYQVLCAYFRSLGGHWSTMELACQFWQGRLQHNEIQLCLQDWSNWTAIPCQGWFVSSYHSFTSLQSLLEPPFLSCKKHCERALCPLRAICLAIPPLF